MATFSATGIPYLVKHQGGAYYWQAKIAGVARRGSMRTKSRSVAQTRLGLELAKARSRFGAGAAREGGGIIDLVTVGEWIDEWLEGQINRVDIKDRTKFLAKEMSRALKRSAMAGMVLKRVKERDVLDWFRGECSRVSPGTANLRLAGWRSVFGLAKEWGELAVNPAAEVKRKPVIKRLRRTVAPGVIRDIARSIRGQESRYSRETAAMVEAAAFSGLRPAELAAVEGKDIQGGWLAVRGGKEGTKNRRERLVPINPALEEIIEREGWRERAGRLFTIKRASRPMRAACLRLGVPHVTQYDLRHFFATSCIERGIDVATVAEWMGHQDGGVLLLKTYTHVRKAHSAAAAAGLRFD
jgi:integrase